MKRGVIEIAVTQVRSFVFCLFVACFTTSTACCSPDIATGQLDSYQTIQIDGTHSTGGFLRYVGRYDDRQIVVLANDIGSAVPSEDLRIYVQKYAGYRLMISVPTLQYLGFQCIADGDILRVFLVKHRPNTRHQKGDGTLFMTIDLRALTTASKET